MIEKVGIAGVGALGSIVARAILDGMEGYALHAVSNIAPTNLPVPHVDFDALARDCDVVVECLPASAVPALADCVLTRAKTLIMISACAAVLYPDILIRARESSGRIIVPCGALSGLDAVTAMAQGGIDTAKIISAKPPRGLETAPYVVQNGIDLKNLKQRTMVFSGNVLDAAAAFPANVNVAASLALAGIGPERTNVEIWADPQASRNTHVIEVSGRTGTIRTEITNAPDPANPKSSIQAAYSIIAALQKRRGPFVIL